MAEHERFYELIPLYALGALTPSEAKDLESHLIGCPRCQDELSLHMNTVAGLDGAREPPDGVWERIATALDESGDPGAVRLLRASQPRTWAFVAGAVAVAAAVFGGVLLAQLIGADPLGQGAIIAAAEEASAREGSIVAELRVDDAVVAEIVLTGSGQGFVLPSEELAPLDESRTYQLWVINSDEAVISAGALGSDPGASTFTWTGNVAGFALTREVAGGVVSSAGDVVSVVTDL